MVRAQTRRSVIHRDGENFFESQELYRLHRPLNRLGTGFRGLGGGRISSKGSTMTCGIALEVFRKPMLIVIESRVVNGRIPSVEVVEHGIDKAHDRGRGI